MSIFDVEPNAEEERIESMLVYFYDHQNLSAEFLNIIAVLSDVKKEKLLKHFPKIFANLQKRVCENDMNLNSEIAANLGKFVANTIRKIEISSSEKVLKFVFDNLVKYIQTSSRPLKIANSMCLAAVLKASPQEPLKRLGLLFYSSLRDFLIVKFSPIIGHLLEMIISIIKVLDQDSDSIDFESMQFSMEFLANNSDWRIKMLALELIKTLINIGSQAIEKGKEMLISVLSQTEKERVLLKE